ncbi:MAG: hypothetical protein HY365_03915 [Candidatus Aenigmarchaeota archaeon]|nr:hypothetical protein [Candidatus Aenigmarchaeota archaeon]
MVKARINSRTPMSDLDIDQELEHSQQFWTMIMKSRGSFGIGGGTFDADKHGALRDAVVARAALNIILATSLSWQSLEQAAMAADGYYQEVIGYMNLLGDRDYVKYLEGL